MDEFLNSQKSVLGITDFLKSANTYTQENFPDLDMNDIFSSAISGNISTNFWTNTILNFARSRSKRVLTTYDNSIDSNNNS